MTHNCQQATHPMPGIRIDPHIQAGQPVVDGTRITTQRLHEIWKAGEQVDAIADDYDLTGQQVAHALLFEPTCEAQTCTMAWHHRKSPTMGEKGDQMERHHMKTRQNPPNVQCRCTDPNHHKKREQPQRTTQPPTKRTTTPPSPTRHPYDIGRRAK